MKKKFKAIKIEAKKPEKQPQKPQFPNNYRFITEHPLLYRTIVGVVYVLLLFGIGASSLNIHESMVQKKRVEQERARIQHEIQYLEKITQDYSGYRDAYLKLAVLQYQLGEFNKARLFAEKGYMLDPNNPKSEELLQNLKLKK